MPEDLRSWFNRHGWAEVDLQRSTDNGLRILMVEQTDTPSTAIFLDAAPAAVTSAFVGLARDLASRHASTVTCHEIVGRDVAVPNPDDPSEPPGFDLRARSFEVAPNLEVHPLEPPLDEDSLAEARGDFDETIENMLDEILDHRREEWTLTWRGYLERSQADLSPRVVDLISAVLNAGAWSAERQGERWMVTVVAKEGKRISVVSDDELRSIRDATKLEPATASR